MTSPLMTISQVARASGIAPSAVRYYERLALVRPTTRVNGRRRYRPSVVERLVIIRMCQDAGFTLTEIGVLLAGRRDGRRSWEPLARQKIVELETQIEGLQQSKTLLEHALECPSPELEKCPHFEAAISTRTNVARS